MVGVARLRKDWAEVVVSADNAIRHFPRYYHFYFAKGQALYHLGKKKEVLEALRTYASYARDERECRDAGKWIKELESNQG